MEALHNIMLANNNQILGMYDEMSMMYGQLDAYKHSGSRLDRSTLLDLYNGGSWSRSFKNREQQSSKMHSTAFNICGFIQPAFIVEMLQGRDPDAFNDRQFFVCPEEVEYKYKELKVPVNPSTPDLHTVFKVIKREHSTQKLQYMFDGEAMDAFIKVHDSLGERKVNIADDENRRGILSKSKGQCARIAMILHVLESALCYEGEPWNTVIPKSAVDKAEHILNYIIDQKFALMHPEIQVKTPTTQCSVPLIPDTYLSKFLSFNKSVISASDVSQYRLMPPSPLTPQSKNKYPVENVRKFMSSISSAGFGQVLEELRSGSKRKATMFRKHSLQGHGDRTAEHPQEAQSCRDVL